MNAPQASIGLIYVLFTTNFYYFDALITDFFYQCKKTSTAFHAGFTYLSHLVTKFLLAT